MSTPDADLIVVGAGICGSIATRTARNLGATVLHIAHPATPHSTAAAAVARSTYLPPRQRPHLPHSLRLLGSAVTCTGALFTNYQTPQKPPQTRTDWYLINPHTPLQQPDLHTTVHHTTPTQAHTDHGTYTARAILLATGATSPLSPPGKITWGTTWTGPTENLTHPDQLRAHLYAPYKTITAGPATDHARVGASTGTSPQHALDNAHKLLTLAHEQGIIHNPTTFTPHTGARLKTHTTTVFHTPTHAWIGGHHRNGYAHGTHETATLTQTLLTNAKAHP